MKVREKYRKKRKRKIILTTLLILCLLAVIIWLLLWKFFVVKDVEVEGNVLYTDDKIESLVLDDEYSWSTIYVIMKFRFRKMEDLPFVDSIEVSMKDQDTLSVTVYEKGMIGYLYVPSIDRNAYFDKDGFVIETSEDVIEGIPRIEGLTADEIVLQEKLDFNNSSALRILLSVTQSLKKYDILPGTIVFGDSNEVLLKYEDIVVELGTDSDMTEKIVRVASIMPKLEGMKGTLHVENWSENSTDIIFEKSE
ncbi:MAG: cell division protein FtsQ/DivIB [Lachnospiraceae bacterium]